MLARQFARVINFSREAVRWIAGFALLGALANIDAQSASEEDSAPARRTVYAWFPARFGSWKTDSLQWDCLTHLCFRSVELTADGKLRRVSGNPPKDFVDTAHRHGVKVTVLVWSRSRADSDGYLARAPQEAASNQLAYVQRWRCFRARLVQ